MNVEVGSPVKTPHGIGKVFKLESECAGNRNWWVQHADGLKRWYAEHNLILLVPQVKV